MINDKSIHQNERLHGPSKVMLTFIDEGIMTIDLLLNKRDVKAYGPNNMKDVTCLYFNKSFQTFLVLFKI